MNADQDKEFESLRRLLKLKRYEQPPPRYFNDFSGQVINRLKLNPQGEASDSESWLGSWIVRLFSALFNRPLAAGGAAAAMCMALLGTLIYSEMAPVPVAQTGAPQPGPGAVPSATPVFSLVDSAMLNSSTNPIQPKTGSIFDMIREPEFDRVKTDHSITP